MTRNNRFPALLKYALLGDAIASGGAGLLMAAGAGVLTALPGLPGSLLQSAGWILIPYALFVAYVGTREEVMRRAVWAIITLNALWAVDSVAVLMTGWLMPTALGYVVVIGQAAVVLGFAIAQFVGLGRASPRRHPLTAE